MSTSRSMTTLSQVMNRLPELGYGEELKIKRDKGAILGDDENIYKPEDLKVVKVYRFEGESDPADMAVIYALQTNEGKKGYLLDSYGTYSGEDALYVNEFIKKIKIERDERLEDLD
ncbi:hypothetical protein [Anditalea andensis]|uniref:Phosphoribosylpyrophosphate synthetase n=1 Tax=Anditalea andensis TaxID=1048983 RepID=A0A074L2F9_9BACT|nr:hypothetical protein [Anditalea andensis]KEO75369.1 hypothetical protein EL17_02185 [Anditalea andensis]